MNDTRKYKRSAVSLRVRFKSATLDDFIEEFSDDVSMGGIFIRSSDPLAVGTLIKFLFLLSDNSTLIEGVGRVVWKREDDNPGMGIKFIKMSEESRECLDMILSGPEVDEDFEEDFDSEPGAETEVAAADEKDDSFSVYTDGGTTSGSLSDIVSDEELFPEDDEPGYDMQDTRVHDVADFALEMEAMLARERQGESFEEDTDTTEELAEAIRESLDEPSEASGEASEADPEAVPEVEKDDLNEDEALSEAYPLAVEPEDSDLATVMQPGLTPYEEDSGGPAVDAGKGSPEAEEPESNRGTGAVLLAVGVVLIVVLGYNILQESDSSETGELPAQEPASVAAPEEPASATALPDAELAIVVPVTDASSASSPDAAHEAGAQSPEAGLDAGDVEALDASVDGSTDDAAAPVYRLQVVTDPPGATLRLGDQEQTSPATFSLDEPRNLTTISVSREGYRNQVARVRRSAFRGDGGALEHRLELTLRPLPAARITATPASSMSAGTMAAGAMSSMAPSMVRMAPSATPMARPPAPPAMARPPARPAMATPPPSGSAPPSNPF